MGGVGAATLGPNRCPHSWQNTRWLALSHPHVPQITRGWELSGGAGVKQAVGQIERSRRDDAVRWPSHWAGTRTAPVERLSEHRAALAKGRDERCKRSCDVGPLTPTPLERLECVSERLECVSERFECLLECREDRCKRLIDVEPLAATLLERLECLSEHRASLSEQREDRCKRLIDVEPLAPTLSERLACVSEHRACLSDHRADRCKRWIDVEPLAPTLLERLECLSEHRARPSEHRARPSEHRADRCTSLYDVEQREPGAQAAKSRDQLPSTRTLRRLDGTGTPPACARPASRGAIV